MEYIGTVFVPGYKVDSESNKLKFAGWKSIETIIVNENSVVKAVKSITNKAAQEFQCSSIHLDSVVEKDADENEKRVYHTVWDETDPLASVRDAA